MRILKLFFVSALILIPISASAQGNGKGRSMGHGKGNRSAAMVYFQPGDIVMINQYYRPVDLPPGLRKKLARQGRLPPGWQKHFRPFPPDLDARLPPLCGSCGRGYFGNAAIVYDNKTAIIYDIAQLAADIAR